jgi:hypothetical protein
LSQRPTVGKKKKTHRKKDQGGKGNLPNIHLFIFETGSAQVGLEFLGSSPLASAFQLAGIRCMPPCLAQLFENHILDAAPSTFPKLALPRASGSCL